MIVHVRDDGDRKGALCGRSEILVRSSRDAIVEFSEFEALADRCGWCCAELRSFGLLELGPPSYFITTWVP